MRVLDLGVHDGYIDAWLVRHFGEEFQGLHIDGIELHPEAVASARRRFQALGAEGTFVQGDALEAERHFAAGTYDAVVAFELIEHVPDPEALLEVAEQMVSPGGRVYVSTPDGTFGEGQNPHHLRVYRAADLADLLRRRGALCDMAVGPDGVTVASYVPGPRRGEVAIFCGQGWQRWSPLDIERSGLGGSETAAVRLAEELSELGYVVTVYGECEQCCFRDVIFRHWSAFDPLEPRLATIVSRMPEVFDRPLASQVRMLWLHDTDCGDRLTARRAEQIDHVLCLSRWHTAHVQGLYPFLAAKVRQIRNGIALAYFRQEAVERQRRVVHTSSPDRGLDRLLELWPEIRRRVPDAELVWCYATVYDAAAEQQPNVGAHHRQVTEMTERLEGVTRLPAQSQPALARLLRSSLVWAHTCWSSAHGDLPFHETSCIAAMEAQAAGCLVVASEWGALPETVKAGHLIGAEPLSERWRDAFVSHIVEGLVNKETQAWVQKAGPEAMAEMGWSGVARQVAGLIEGEAFAFEGGKAPAEVSP